MKKRRLLAVTLVLALVLGSVALPAGAAFQDAKGHWAQEAIERWEGRGVVKGDEKGFRPDDPMTRAEFAVVLDRLMAYAETKVNPFKDVPAGTWYTKSVLGAAAAGILLGTDVDKASPGDRITREQAFTLMGRALMVKENEAGTAAYSDAAEISKYAKGYIGGMTAAGILHGSNGKCSPKSNITRAEVITVVDNAIGDIVDKAGEYQKDSEKSVIVNAAGAVLKDMAVKGNLIIAEGVGSGDVTLDGVTVEGSLVLRGGGEHSVVIKGKSKLGTVLVNRRDGKLRVAVEDGAEVEIITVEDGSDDVRIEGEVGTLIVENTEAAVEVAGSAGKVEVPETAAGAQVKVAEGASVGTLNVAAPKTNVEVSGSVSSLTVQETAEAAAVTVNAAAAVSSMTSAADKLNVDGKGTVQNLTVTGGEGVVVSGDTKVSNVQNKGDDSILVGGEEVKPDTGSGGGGGTVTPPVTPAPTEAELKKALLDKVNSEIPGVNGVMSYAKLSAAEAQGSGYAVSVEVYEPSTKLSAVANDVLAKVIGIVKNYGQIETLDVASTTGISLNAADCDQKIIAAVKAWGGSGWNGDTTLADVVGKADLTLTLHGASGGTSYTASYTLSFQDMSEPALQQKVAASFTGLGTSVGEFANLSAEGAALKVTVKTAAANKTVGEVYDKLFNPLITAGGGYEEFKTVRLGDSGALTKEELKDAVKLTAAVKGCGLGVAGTTKLSQLAGKSIDVVLASNAGKTYTFTLSFVNETTEA